MPSSYYQDGNRPRMQQMFIIVFLLMNFSMLERSTPAGGVANSGTKHKDLIKVGDIYGQYSGLSRFYQFRRA